MLTNEILDNWAGSPSGYASTLRGLSDSGYESWIIGDARPRRSIEKWLNVTLKTR